MSALPLLFLAAAQIAADSPATNSIRCEAPGGHFRFIKLIGATQNLSATVHILRQQPGTKIEGYWAPAAGLLFAVQKKNETAGIQVYINPYEPNRMKVTLRQPGFTGGTIDFASAPVDKTLSISAGLVGDALTVSADGIRQTARVTDKVTGEAMLMCSSGAFEFTLTGGLHVDPATAEQSFDPWTQKTK
jgi:hypothetical protein